MMDGGRSLEETEPIESCVGVGVVSGDPCCLFLLMRKGVRSGKGFEGLENLQDL